MIRRAVGVLGLGLVVASPVACRGDGPFREGQTWVGKYVCAQGATDLTLKITSVKKNNLESLFDFVHADSGSKGVFKLSGRYQAKTRTVDLEPVEWIGPHPPRWEMVGLSGAVSPDGRRLSGAITHSNCTAFSLSLNGR